MLAASPGPRIIMCTLAACAERNTAACPAELPPPTSTISQPVHILASRPEAQYQTPRPSNSSMRPSAGRR